MNLSVSNIAWAPEYDDEMYALLAASGYRGLEVAPTRLFPQSPYTHLDEAYAFSRALYAKYGLVVCSMQSIWFGRTERLFGSASERNALMEYTKEAILFAEALGCSNLVFGSPKNRILPEVSLFPLAVDFFHKAGEFAALHGCVIAIEPNPEIYGTNFINTTEQAFALCREVNSSGCMVNADIGTCIQNGESLSSLHENINLIHHIHVSEPMLEPILRRELHMELRSLNYDGWVSIEMKRTDNWMQLRSVVEYLTEVLS